MKLTLIMTQTPKIKGTWITEIRNPKYNSINSQSAIILVNSNSLFLSLKLSMLTNQKKMRTVTISTKKILIQTLYINLYPTFLKKKMMNSSWTMKNKKMKKKLLLPLTMTKNKKSKSLSLMNSK